MVRLKKLVKKSRFSIMVKGQDGLDKMQIIGDPSYSTHTHTYDISTPKILRRAALFSPLLPRTATTSSNPYFACTSVTFLLVGITYEITRPSLSRKASSWLFPAPAPNPKILDAGPGHVPPSITRSHLQLG